MINRADNLINTNFIKFITITLSGVQLILNFDQGVQGLGVIQFGTALRVRRKNARWALRQGVLFWLARLESPMLLQVLRVPSRSRKRPV